MENYDFPRAENPSLPLLESDQNRPVEWTWQDHLQGYFLHPETQTFRKLPWWLAVYGFEDMSMRWIAKSKQNAFLTGLMNSGICEMWIVQPFIAQQRTGPSSAQMCHLTIISPGGKGDESEAIEIFFFFFPHTLLVLLLHRRKWLWNALLVRHRWKDLGCVPS